ncbi:MAG: HYR domain-containing protein [Acidobacteria bacterium]|nr:HYR domain-containing protein [Acidobacteriota bacterium]
MFAKRAWLLVFLMFGLLVASPNAQNPPRVVVWGSNENQQRDVPAGLTDVIAVAAGGSHSLALKSDGTVVAWGSGNGMEGFPEGLTGVIAISSHYAHNLALKSDGTVVAWGYNYYGECNVPAGLTDVKAISAGENFSLALKADGTVVGWGANMYNQIAVPAGLDGVKAIAAGAYHGLALRNDGTVVAWGRGRYDDEPATVPAFLTDASTANIKALAAGFTHSVGLREDGTVVEWLADVEWWNKDGLTGVTAISASTNYDRMALKEDGTVVAWGEGDSYGQRNVPADLTGATAIAIGWRHALAFGVLPPDTTPPTLTVPPDVTAEATGSTGTPVDIGQATATDNRDANPVVTNDAPTGGFPLGVTTVTWTATDASGNKATAVQLVTVKDTTPPTITAPPDVTAQQTGSGGTPVNLGLATATDIADPNPTITNNAPALFPVGITTVTWTATDHSGNSATATQKVTVVAPPPSAISASATPNTVWPPNKKMVPIVVTVTATSGPAPSTKIVGVTCNETIAASDVVITGLKTVSLRADRDGNGTGRVYTIKLQCTTPGSTCAATVDVKVPHDQGK